MLELEQFIKDKSFAINPCQGALMVIKVEDLIDWLIRATTQESEE